MEEYSFAVPCWFLPYNNAVQPKLCIYHLPLEPPSPPLSPLLSVITEHLPGLLVLYGNFLPAIWNGKGQVEYLITFIYDALQLFTHYPKIQSQTGTQRSTEVMSEIAAQTGIEGVSTDVDTDDEQYWFNPGMKAYDYLKYVIAHSWINEKDFGMFWVGKDGKGRFSGMKENMENGRPYFFETEYNNNLQERVKHLIFSDVYQEDLSSMTVDELKNKYANKSFIFLMMYSGCKLNKQGDNIQP